MATKRLEVLKTYKLYIGGKFPRTESGRYYKPINKKGEVLGNICLSSRKDFKNAVVEARKAVGDWSGKSEYNRSQILYRIAEILEGRKAQFIEELKLQGSTKNNAEKEVENSIDKLVYYAGWCDKYQQIFSSVNPVASSHFNFSVCEPTGVVAVITPQENALLGLISVVAPIIAGGNTCVLLAAENLPLCSISFAEVLATSDVPAGVINILTGKVSELAPHFSTHKDVNALVYCGGDKDLITNLTTNAADNMKRVKVYDNKQWQENSPYLIKDFQEIKTTWHPVENIGGAGAGY